MADGPEELRIHVEGETYELNDLSFKERKEVRRLARVAADDPDAELEDLEMDYLIVAFITVCKNRTDPAFDIEDAMEMKLTDVAVPVPADPPEPATKARRRGAGAGG